MSALTQAFFALDRKATEEFLMMAVKEMDDLTLKKAVHTLVSSWSPSLLKKFDPMSVPTKEKDLSCYSHEPYVLDETLFVNKAPKIRGAEKHWPFMRCKNVARALQDSYNPEPLPRNHQALLEHIAQKAGVSVDILKNTSARTLFKYNFRVLNALGDGCGWEQ